MSEFQRAVAHALERLGYPIEMEHVTGDGTISIDVAIVPTRIAVEVNGPSHYARHSHTPLGHTKLREQLLAAMGWSAISIPFFEWECLRDTEQQAAYLQRRISEIDALSRAS